MVVQRDFDYHVNNLYIDADWIAKWGRTTSNGSAGLAELRNLSILRAGPVEKKHTEDLSQDKLRAFQEKLQGSGIDVSTWGVDGTKSVEHLFWEAYEQRGCLITEVAGLDGLRRVVQLVKVRLSASIHGVQHELSSRTQLLHDGQHVEKKQTPLTKLRWISDCSEGAGLYDEHCIEKECPYTEDWRAGVKKVLTERIGLTEQWQRQHLEEQLHAYSFHFEEEDSKGYPGLRTFYCIHQLSAQVVNPDHPDCMCIGLPDGRDFATMEGEFDLFSQQVRERMPIGTRLNVWTWSRSPLTRPPSAPKGIAPTLLGGSVANARKTALEAPEPEKEPQPLIAAVGPVRKCLRLPAEVGPDDCCLQKQVPLPHFQIVPGPAGACNPQQKLPNAMLGEAARGWLVDWSHVERIASRIADPDYTLQSFYGDLMAFPELGLYLLEGKALAACMPNIAPSTGLDGRVSGNLASSGRTFCEEYQRTIGAFFAIYWLLRLPSDGREGFSFGVDSSWMPLGVAEWDSDRLFPSDKRLKFHSESQWSYLEKLLVDAGLVTGKRPDGTFQVNIRRVTALLALTAIHDVMKMEVLLPEVQEEHAPYHGYMAGDVIGDHDHALSYLMDYFPHLLPSFNGLAAEERSSVHFTQCQLGFNHGWFVQGEAPPAANLGSLREITRQDRLSRHDVSFYFVHWLTDLAGSEPTPLAGCEKFVTKFPLAVLNSFLRSFEFVQKIADYTETEVVEDYLKVRWQESSPSMGPVPSGEGAIASMRLLCMAQTNAAPILKAFSQLPPRDRLVLSKEMARTGSELQHFELEPSPEEDVQQPALLIYYGPAFLQNLGADDPTRRLSALAEVFRRARMLWPAGEACDMSHVIVRIDAIKALSMDDIAGAGRADDHWVLVRRNRTEAFIERVSTKNLQTLRADNQSLQVLDFA